jgi:hypothetical protein
MPAWTRSKELGFITRTSGFLRFRNDSAGTEYGDRAGGLADRDSAGACYRREGRCGVVPGAKAPRQLILGLTGRADTGAASLHDLNVHHTIIHRGLTSVPSPTEKAKPLRCGGRGSETTQGLVVYIFSSTSSDAFCITYACRDLQFIRVAKNQPRHFFRLGPCRIRVRCQGHSNSRKGSSQFYRTKRRPAGRNTAAGPR